LRTRGGSLLLTGLILNGVERLPDLIICAVLQDADLRLLPRVEQGIDVAKKLFLIDLKFSVCGVKFSD
jgi:hypothetical protein